MVHRSPLSLRHFLQPFSQIKPASFFSLRPFGSALNETQLQKKEEPSLWADTARREAKYTEPWLQRPSFAWTKLTRHLNIHGTLCTEARACALVHAYTHCMYVTCERAVVGIYVSEVHVVFHPGEWYCILLWVLVITNHKGSWNKALKTSQSLYIHFPFCTAG